MMWVSAQVPPARHHDGQVDAAARKTGPAFLMLNLDDYFWSLVEHPTDWINDRNYETPEALDIQLLNQHLRRCSRGGR